VRADRTSTQQFQETVEKLRVPEMGTEVVAPLLVNLIHLLRPQRVLEVGMGYTTSFLAAALADVQDEICAESVALAAKTARHLRDRAELDDEWLNADPPLLAPAFYLQAYQPTVVAVDDLSIAESSAGRVWQALRELGLDHLVTIVNADIRDCADRFPTGFTPIDFAWVDAWECLYFFDHFWELINPDGGMVLMHYLMTYPEGEAILRYIAEFQRANPGELEIINLPESQKLTQNSVTILRRTSGVQARRYGRSGGQVRYSPELRAAADAHLKATGGCRKPQFRVDDLR
jgi:predicted O-methyltransferase YrrM